MCFIIAKKTYKTQKYINNKKSKKKTFKKNLSVTSLKRPRYINKKTNNVRLKVFSHKKRQESNVKNVSLF